MIAKSDVILLLTELQNNGIDVKEEISKVLSSSLIPLDVLKKIKEHKLEMTLTDKKVCVTYLYTHLELQILYSEIKLTGTFIIDAIGRI